MQHIGLIGSGWLAQGMARAWHNQYQITLTTRDPEKQQQLIAQGISCLIYNMGDEAPWLADIDCLIIATTSKSLTVHQQLLNQIQHHPDLPVLFTSSTSVYPNDGQRHTEDSPYLLKDHPLYLIEHCLQQHPKTTVIRCGGLIGPGRHPGRFFKNKSISAPQAPVNLLPLDDATGIFAHVMENHYIGTTINACHDQHPTKGHYYSTMAESLGLPTPDSRHDSTGQGKIVDTHHLIHKLNYQLQSNIWSIDQ